MDVLARIVDIVVILGMAYLIFVMALAGWIVGLRRGEAVTLLPEQRSRARNLALQIRVGVVSLGYAPRSSTFYGFPSR